jgi:hypothetical protein
VTPEERARALAKYFKWDIPSEQYNQVILELHDAIEKEREACAKAMESFHRPWSETAAKAIRDRK